MGKNNKKNPPVEAPVVENKEIKKEEEVQDLTKIKAAGVPDGLDQPHKVAFAQVLQHRKDEMIRTGNANADKYDALTVIEDATIIDIAVTELVLKKNPSAWILTANEKNYTAIQLLAKDMGVTLPDFKSLPKPTKEQLKAVGLESAADKVVLRIEDKHVSKEAKDQKKKEQKVVEEAFSGRKDYLRDLTKIETDEQLKEALEFQIVNSSISNPIERLIATYQFYRSYLEANAEKASDPQAELAKIHEFTPADLLQDITTMVSPTFVTSGFGKRLCTLAEDANSIIPAFCGFKNCVINRKTGVYKYTDEEIAMFVRVLIVWYASAKVAEISKTIEEKNANIAALKKSDEKANAKAIESETKKIAGLNSAIKHFNGMLSIVTDPSFDIVDNFIMAYNSKENASHMYAVKIADAVMDTYYRNVEVPEIEFDSMLLNIQQHAGIILNLFSTTDMRRDEYSADNLIPFDPPTRENKEEEGGGKNS